MTDPTVEPYLSDAFLGHVERFVVEGVIGSWRLQGGDDGDPAPRIVCADTGATILEPLLPLDDDTEAAVDAVYAMGLAVAAVQAAPLLTREVRRLKRELADAVNAIKGLHAEIEAMNADSRADADRERRRHQRGTHAGDEVRAEEREWDGTRGGD